MSESVQVIIIGASGNCIDILDSMNDINTLHNREIYRCIGFLDDDQTRWGKIYHGVKVLGPIDSAPDHRHCYFINGIGSSQSFTQKESIIGRARIPSHRFANIIHPTASISSMSTLGQGVAILQNVTIASDVVIGNHVIVLPNSIVSHDGAIGDYTCITGGVSISGGVRVGKSCYLGANSSVRENISIGDSSLIGMGSVVIRDIGANSVVIGNPATPMRMSLSGSA